MGKRPKRPTVTVSPKPTKKVPPSPTVQGRILSWRFSAADRGGPFSCASLMADGASVAHVLKRLVGFETMSESGLRQGGSHTIDKGDLSKEAQARLEAIELDDIDQLWSFRITGSARVWCRVESGVMHLLWWDPYHQVCPSAKKYT